MSAKSWTVPGTVCPHIILEVPAIVAIWVDIDAVVLWVSTAML